MSKKIRNYLIFTIVFVTLLLLLIVYIRSNGGGLCAGMGFNLLIQPILAIWSIVTSIILFPKNNLPSLLRFFLIIISLVIIFFLVRGVSLSILDIDSIKGDCHIGP